ncbi:YsnF/AvaK domain-containing protein [Aureimonas leprariae]|uniref:DUF2382 domain-containing protein n=1 Tax=Plantimonas leprariae TaxID=2615207 RepID=A0A7V7TXU8_9HYPH|nr:YsnF/AvaK domain-containing protein [Aureimonas leprariae]KAB0676182.1 DUF2382 domain-containing protein [Aureimonas leprariae]
MSLNTTSTTSRQTLTAFFDSRSDAEAAIERVVDAGVSRDEIRLVEGTDSSATATTTTTTTEPVHERGFFEALGDFFLPDEDRHSYAEGLSRGGYLVSVSTTDHNRDAILDILDDEGTVDMDERESTWRSEGWSGQSAGYDAAAVGTSSAVGYGSSDSLVSRDDVETRPVGTTGTGAAQLSGSAAETTNLRGDAGVRDRDGTIEVVEENLKVGKRDVAGGRVRVRSYVREEPVSENVSLHSEHVEIERRPVDRPVEAGDAAFRDQTLELEERAEEAVVSKEARVKEEIDLRKVGTERTETVSDTVRRTEVDIEDERRNQSLSEDEVRQQSARRTGTLGLPSGGTDKKL